MRRRFVRRRRTFPRRRFPRIYHFKRTVGLGEIEVVTADVKRVETVSLASIQNHADFTNLFDAYRINKAVIKYLPRQNVVVGNMPVAQTTVTNGQPVCITAIDYNDNNSGFSQADLLEYQNHRIHKGFGPITRKWTPAVEVAVEGSTGAAIVGNQKFKQWIDVAAFDARHHGLKAIFSPVSANSTTGYLYEVFLTLYFSCKQVK